MHITVALEPNGAQKIKGELLYFKGIDSSDVFVMLDDKEFNFHNLTKRINTKSRVYIRTIITCHNEQGDTILAWAYVYVSKTFRPSVLVNQNTSYGTDVEFIPITYDDYLAKLKQVEQ